MPRSIIAVDMMGGDNAPDSMIAGVAEALQRFGDTSRLLLVGDTPVLKKGLSALGVDIDDPRIEFHHSEQVVGMDEHPAQAVRSKRRSSICIAADLVKAGEAQGMFSIGNTGAAVGAAFLKWRMLPGLARPGIATVLPGENRRWILMDSGATVDCSATNLAQFAIMGAAYARTTLGIASPKVGLLSNGTEEGKGNRATQEAYQLIQNIKELNFVGNVEGHDLFSDAVDVVVCDGFMGNIVLKSSERLAKMMSSLIKRTLVSRFVWKLGAAICKNAFKEVKKATDASEVGGAPLLGVNGCCVIGHGNSDAHAVANGINAVAKLIAADINNKIVEQVHNADLDNLS